ncbi:MAG: hypothetical protein HN961_06215, partial [Planctomycetes bacterium]|nr:hypothetical protein [Planctomycetota bacterium]
MAKSLGIRLQPDGYAFALLDGSSKKFTVSSCGSGDLSPAAATPETYGAALARAWKETGGKADKITICAPALGSVLREIAVPFSDRDKIMQVLKFEIESELYHIDIDDVVCDYIELQDDRATTSLLTTSMPKSTIEQAIDIAEAAGFDAQFVQVEHGAFVAAIGSLPQDDSAAPTGYLHIGSSSCLLVVMASDGPAAVQVFPFGWRDLDAAEPDGALEIVVDDGADTGDDADTGDQDADESSADTEPTVFLGKVPQGSGQSFETVCELATPESLEAFRKRLVTEARRALSAFSGMLSGFYLLGDEIPGLAEQFEARMGLAVGPLDLGHATADGTAPCPIALGAALSSLDSGVGKMQFRQEEFVFTQGLDRVEGALTLALVGLLAFLLMDLAVHVKKAGARQADCEAVFQHAVAKIEQLNETLDDSSPKNWFVRTNFDGSVVAEESRILKLSGGVSVAEKSFNTLVGEGDLEMPHSCLEAWRLVLNTLEEQLGEYSDRWMLESLTFSAQDSSRNEDAHVLTKIGVTVFG